MGKRKILVVDDEPDFLKIIKMWLDVNEFETLLCDNGKDALALIKKEKPDAVLLDVLLPGMDGLEVLQKIRKQDKNLPVFIITAFSNNERFELARKFNASGFIVKTSDMKEEIANINSFLRMLDSHKK